MEGISVERDDFEQLKDSEVVHGLITTEVSSLSKGENIAEIVNAMATLGDEETSTLFNTHSIDLKSFDIRRRQEEHDLSLRRSLLGPVYSSENWELIKNRLAPILKKRSKSKTDYGKKQFLWIAPSDPYWGKSQRIQETISDILTGADQNKKKLYSTKLYLPVSEATDTRSAAHWNREFNSYIKQINGLAEGFLGGNVEVMYLENELVVVIYHVSHPDFLPVSLPVGFVSTDKKVVKDLGLTVKEYINGFSAFEKPNDCGPITTILSQRSR